jgi:hypothetical protein
MVEIVLWVRSKVAGVGARGGIAGSGAVCSGDRVQRLVDVIEDTAVVVAMRRRRRWMQTHRR